MTSPLPRDEASGDRSIRIVHLFPDLLSVYGDSGNVRTLVGRAERRGIHASVERVLADDDTIPTADLFVIGGGQDRDQLRVARSLARLGGDLVRQVADGAALLAVCGGYQCLGRTYATSANQIVTGPGLLDVETINGAGRLVGPVVATLSTPVFDATRTTVVGFENHGGRTSLGGGARPLATVEIGSGNNGSDRGEGILALPGDGGLRGLRIGTYLHGPLLPRNPHIADALIRAALARSNQPMGLAPLDDTAAWAAHDAFLANCRRRPLVDRLPSGVRRIVAPVRSLVGF